MTTKKKNMTERRTVRLTERHTESKRKDCKRNSFVTNNKHLTRFDVVLPTFGET